MRPKLTPEININYELRLKYPTGMDVEGRYGNQKMFTVIDRDGCEQVLYLPVEVGRQIEGLGLGPDERFDLRKRERKNGRSRSLEWAIARVDPPGVPPRQTAARPSAADARRAEATPEAQQQPQANTGAVVPIGTGRRGVDGPVSPMAECLTAAIDALLIAKEYGARRGWELPFTEEDVRATAASLFIQRAKETEGAVRAAAGGASWRQ